MSRMAAGDVVVRRPENNVYTVLAVVGTVVAVLGLVVVYLQGQTLGVW